MQPLNEKEFFGSFPWSFCHRIFFFLNSTLEGPTLHNSVADPGCLSWIWIFFFPSRIRIKEFKYFNPKNCFSALGNMIRIVHSGSGSWIFTHPGSRGQKGPRSRVRIRNTAARGAAHHKYIPWTCHEVLWPQRNYLKYVSKTFRVIEKTGSSSRKISFNFFS
jgi:hypothetical protein